MYYRLIHVANYAKFSVKVQYLSTKKLGLVMFGFVGKKELLGIIVLLKDLL